MNQQGSPELFIDHRDHARSLVFSERGGHSRMFQNLAEGRKGDTFGRVPNEMCLVGDVKIYKSVCDSGVTLHIITWLHGNVREYAGK